MTESLALRPYQDRMQKHLIAHPYCALWADMGAGKTATVLSAILRLVEDLDVARVLVVAPKRVALNMWPAEVAKWAQFQGLSVRVLTAKDFGLQFREVAIKRRGEETLVKRLTPTIAPQAFFTGETITTISRDLLHVLVALLGRRGWCFDMLVLDDVGMRDSGAKKFAAVKALRTHGCLGRLVQLSGTPRPKSLLDLWPQLYLLDRGQRLGRTMTGYKAQWFVPDKRSRDGRQVFSYRPIPGAEDDIFKRVSDICVSLLPEDVVQLPERTINVIPLQLTGRAREAYRQMARHQLFTVDGADITAGNAAVLVGKLLQLASGAVYDEDGRVQRIHDVKMECLEEVIESLNGVPLLIGYWFAHERDRIKARFPQAVELNDYPDTEDRWNRGEIDLLMLHPQGGAHGLNLQFNDGQGFWFGPIHDYELWQQWNKRLHRPGRKTPVMIHVPIISDTIEREVLESLGPKGEGQDRLLRAVRIEVEKLTKVAA